MLFDCNAYIGHYPFRQTSHKTAAQLISLMDAAGVDKACVSSLQGMYYRDVMAGNYELLEEIKPYGDRFVPFCNIKPGYAQAKSDFIRCARELGFRGVKLFPRSHSYALDGADSVEILNLAARLNVPVQLPIYVEDVRGRHSMDAMNAITGAEILSAAKKAPDTTFILSNYVHQAYAPLLAKEAGGKSGRFYYDLGRMDNLNQDSFTVVADAAGLDHILFGTGAPLQYIDVQLVKLAFLPQTHGLSEARLEGIRSGNLKKLLGM